MNQRSEATTEPSGDHGTARGSERGPAVLASATSAGPRSQHQQGLDAGVADATAALPNRLSVKGDMGRFQQSDAWCKGYDHGYRWKAYGPGRFVNEDTDG